MIQDPSLEWLVDARNRIQSLMLQLYKGWDDIKDTNHRQLALWGRVLALACRVSDPQEPD
jgi:hypothetical protein